MLSPEIDWSQEKSPEQVSARKQVYLYQSIHIIQQLSRRHQEFAL